MRMMRMRKTMMTTMMMTTTMIMSRKRRRRRRRRRKFDRLEQEHEQLFYSCARSLRRGFKGNASYFLATDLPQETRKGGKKMCGGGRKVEGRTERQEATEERRKRRERGGG